MKQKEISPEIVSKMTTDYNDGSTLRALSKFYSIPVSTIRFCLHKSGVILRKRGPNANTQRKPKEPKPLTNTLTNSVPIEETTEQTATQEQSPDSPSVEEKPRETTDDLI